MQPSAAADALFADLNGPQREAVAHVDGPLLVLAGPGSGKTRVITRRIAHLIRGQGVAPWHILAITFTNKAAGEMRERVAGLLSPVEARRTTVCTFHALCARLLRQYGDQLGLPAAFSIYDTTDQQRAMKQALTDAEVSSNHFPPSKVLAAVSHAKNELLDADAYAASVSDFYHKNVARLYRAYQRILARSNALDFDDLLLKTVELLKIEALRTQLQERFQYLLIDEYQDTNRAQFTMASLLAAAHRNICATGDPDQSIYRWRGADIRNILDFQSHYPNAAVVRLEQNYRSTKRILEAADTLIHHNTQRQAKALFTNNEEGQPIRLLTCVDERHEARCIVERLVELHDREKLPWSEMALFYRTNSLSRVLEEACRTASIPYQIARGTAFYERKEIKDALAYLRAIANPADTINLARILNTPARGISDKTLQALQLHALNVGATLCDVLHRVGEIRSLNARAVSAVVKFTRQLSAWRHEIEHDGSDMSLRGFVEQVLRDSGLEDYYRKDASDPDEERLANLGELITAVQQFEQQLVDEQLQGGIDEPLPLGERLNRYLEQVSLVSDIDGLDTSQGAVTLMTLHAAKGLEFAAVAIVGVEDGLLPHSQSSDDRQELEEERRLAFVGITRAKRFLSLSHARYRTIFGRTEPTIPSRFLRELPQERIESIDRTDEEGLDTPSRDTQALRYPPGTLVRHPSFGLGRVVRVQPHRSQTRIQVQFNTSGVKTLILEYAPLERV